MQFPEDITTVAPTSTAMSSMASSARRHPTWSHELHLMERRPRSRRDELTLRQPKNFNDPKHQDPQMQIYS